jgi:indole-3-glycerol phosphate synthase
MAVNYGADCVLLIVRLLTDAVLSEFIQKAESLGLEALVEAHNQREIETAVGAGAKIIGINNRNLESFETNITNTFELAKNIPAGIIKVSESGIKEFDDIRRLSSEGIDAVLIGETLMRSIDIKLKIRELLGRA